jgi:hypothetical protein
MVDFSVSGAGRSDTPTAWAVNCHAHGLVFLTELEYQRQMSLPNACLPNALWVCPSTGCGRPSQWNDEVSRRVRRLLAWASGGSVMFDENTQLETTVIGVGFRAKDNRQHDKVITAEVRCSAHLTPELAEELQRGLSMHLFVGNNRKGTPLQPRPELSIVGLEIEAMQYVLEVRSHPEIKRPTRLAGIRVRNVQARKSMAKDTANVWLLDFVVAFMLQDPAECLHFVKYLKKVLFLTFTEQQPALEGLDEKAPESDQEADVDAGGVATVRKKGEKRQKPEEVH